MEQHGSELNNQNEREEEHKHQTDGLELQILLRDVHLNRVSIGEKYIRKTESFRSSQHL